MIILDEIPDPEEMYASEIGINEPLDIEEDDMIELELFQRKLWDFNILPYQFDLHMKRCDFEWRTGDTAKTLKGDMGWNPDAWILINNALNEFIAETSEEGE